MTNTRSYRVVVVAGCRPPKSRQLPEDIRCVSRKASAVLLRRAALASMPIH